MELKFHLDESVAHAVARGLILRGVDTTTSTDPELLGVTDQQQLDHAIRAGRMLVTHDQDFLRLAAQLAAHPGIAYCPPEHRSIGQIVLRLVHLWRTMSAEQMQGRIEFL
jgi:predicted nuclease of predicted toxin-antitoxin system